MICIICGENPCICEDICDFCGEENQYCICHWYYEESLWTDEEWKYFEKTDNFNYVCFGDL